MNNFVAPAFFCRLQNENCIDASQILSAGDGFLMVYKSIAQILAEKGIVDFPNLKGQRLACSSFFDDWFIYAVASGEDYVYSLVKLREQEHDAEAGAPADGDIPGVTVSFVAFATEVLLDCITDPTDENRQRLGIEIDRVVVSRGQRHHPALKWYFINPAARGAYLIAELYTKHIAALAENGYLPTPDCYLAILQRSISNKHPSKYGRLPGFIETLNKQAGYTVCDNHKIYIRDPQNPNEWERLAILATHTGDVSVYCFAAEVEYHARFLTPLARVRLPLFGRSIYDSAIRADMTVGDTEFEGPAPFHQPQSKIVKRQLALHGDINVK